MQRYENYKPSGVKWLGEVPAHWDILPFKGLFFVSNEKNGKSIVGEMLSVSGYRGVEVKKYEFEEQKRSDAELRDYRVVRQGQLVVNTMWLNYSGLGVSEIEGHVSPAYRAYCFDSKLRARYVHYLMRSHPYVQGYTGQMQGIRPNSLQIKNCDFTKIPVLVPPHEEQDRIVAFLDQKTAEIDAAIAKKERLIELLKVQQHTLIRHAVSCGLNAEVPFQDNNTKWLEKTPSHWKIQKIKYCSKIFRGKFTHRPRNDPRLYDGPYPFIQTGDVARAGKFITEFKQTLNERGLRVSTLIPKGTVVITIAANIGDISILGFDACFPDSVVGFLPGVELERDYFYLALSVMKRQFMASSTQNTQMNLNVDRIGSNSIAIPPLHEQKEIINWADKITDISESAQAKLVDEIGALMVLKSTVVANVVTGKLRI